MFDAPMPAAPENAMTCSDWFTPAPSTDPTDCVLVTVTLLSAVVAVAVQISATPRCTAARRTRVHVRPPPEIVRFWVLVPVVGPSEAASAMSTAPGVVLNGAVVRGPTPSENTLA